MRKIHIYRTALLLPTYERGIQPEVIKDNSFYMTRKLPPLNSLRAFESSARLKSFTKAAEELHVTQSAVSKQVKLLEDFLGITLFRRKNQLLELTEEAQLYLPSISSVFSTIEIATDQIIKNQKRAEILNINILPSWSIRWLIPRIDEFKNKNPNITVNIITGDGPVDFSQNDIDVAIRVSRKNDWRGVHVEKIMGENLVAVCSPELAKLIKSPEDLKNQKLLKHTWRPDMWREWLERVGYGYVTPNLSLGFEHFFMLIQAAMQGSGVALVPRLLVEEELSKRKLSIPFKVNFKSPYVYYLLCPKHKTSLERVKLFNRWILSITEEYR